MKVTYINILKRFNDFDHSMHEKVLLIERKFEKMKFTNEKNSVDFENNEANNRNNNSNVNLITMATVKVENNNKQI